MQRTLAPGLFRPGLPGQQLIDLRRPADREASQEQIAGSLWLNPADVDGWCQSLDRDADIVIYCVRGGSVSNAVIDALHAKGIAARYLDGGLESWKAQGGAVVAI